MALIYAHRGFSALYPENTMLAFRKAAMAGADGIELDVHLSKDGEVMIIHDEKLGRTCGLDGVVSDYTRTELEKINAGKTKDERFGFTPIPSLDEYLEFAKEEGIVTNIELKTAPVSYPDIEEKVLALVDRYSLSDKVIYSSFNALSVMHLKMVDGNARTALLFDACKPMYLGHLLARSGFSYFHPSLDILSDDVARDMHVNGIKMNIWTVDGDEKLRKALSFSPEGIISNDVERAVAYNLKSI